MRPASAEAPRPNNDDWIEDEWKLPQNSTLKPCSIRASLRTASGLEVKIMLDTSLRHPERNPKALLVGRQAETADIRIQHASISRKHALLYYLLPEDPIVAGNKGTGGGDSGDTVVEERLVVQDCGSKYGTTVNGKRIPNQSSLMLHNGDRILFGNVRESVFQVVILTTPLSATSGVSSVATATATASQSEHATLPSETPAQISIQEEALDREKITKAGQGLTGRAKRAAEIEAMIQSLDMEPTYHATASDPTTPADIDAVNYEPPRQQEWQQQQQSLTSKIEVEIADAARKHNLPVTSKLLVSQDSDRPHSITCIALDPSGARFAVGCTDTQLRLYDFGGMDRRRTQAFNTINPDDGHWPVSCAYSPTGDRIVVGTGSVQPVVLDRDGEEVIKFVRGDMYVSDQSKTSGHTASVTGVDWHPLERDIVLTSSLDGSARLWDLNGKTQFQMLVCSKVFQAKNARGHRTAVTAVTFHPGGREFVLGTACGSIQIWSVSRVSGRPERAVFDAHGPNHGISSISFNVNGTHLVSRSSSDDVALLWDAKRLSHSSKPLVSFLGMPTLYERANAAFSPDGGVICAGASGLMELEKKSRSWGRLQFYQVLIGENTSSSEPILSLAMDPGLDPIVVTWHSKLNQIFVGCSNGQLVILFDFKQSVNGAVMATHKKLKEADQLEELLKARAPAGTVLGEIVAPVSLPLFREDKPNKKQRLEARKDPVKSREPQRPATGKHRTGSQVGGQLTFDQFVSDRYLEKKKTIAGRDPREALFKYKEGKSFIDKAYSGNSSRLADKTAEEEEDSVNRNR